MEPPFFIQDLLSLRECRWQGQQLLVVYPSLQNGDTWWTSFGCPHMWFSYPREHNQTLRRRSIRYSSGADDELHTASSSQGCRFHGRRFARCSFLNTAFASRTSVAIATVIQFSGFIRLAGGEQLGFLRCKPFYVPNFLKHLVTAYRRTCKCPYPPSTNLMYKLSEFRRAEQ